MSDLDPQAVARALLGWYGRAGRDLPWRRSRDPYRIWLSEIMLQQTTVEAVKGYYARFLDAFPSVADLAAAPVERVLDLWAGLGYYRRAHNLHRAAQAVMTDHGGVFPDTVEALMTLPGVGRSTAGAIGSIAFDLPAPILDANVRRVLCRLYALDDDPRGSAAERQLWTWAETLTPADRPHDYAQAIMDLGATLCNPRSPRCPECPLVPFCRARAQGRQQELPRKAARKAVPTRREVALVLCRRGQIFLRRRPPTGLLAGLWEFPTASVAEGQRARTALTALQRQLGVMGTAERLGAVRHTYSHFRLELDLFLLPVEECPHRAAAETLWAPAAALSDLALHGAHKKAVPLLADHGMP